MSDKNIQDPGRRYKLEGMVSGQMKPHELIFTPTMDGKQCPYLVLQTDKAKRLAGLESVLKDLDHVCAALKLLVSWPGVLGESGDEGDKVESVRSHRQTIGQSLWFSAVTTYGKCFTTAEGRQVHLDDRRYLRGTTGEQQRLHRELIGIRNTYVAHGGQSEEELGDVKVILAPEGGEREVVSLFPCVIGQSQTSPRRALEYLRLVEKVVRNVQQEQKEAMDVLWEELKARPINELYEPALHPPHAEEKDVVVGVTIPGTCQSTTPTTAPESE